MAKPTPWIRKYRPDEVAPNGIGVSGNKFVAQPTLPGVVSAPYTEDWGLDRGSDEYKAINVQGIPYYNLKSINSGYSPSTTKGKSKIDGKYLSNMSALPNCVGLAWGIYNETYVRNMERLGQFLADGFYYHVNGNGEYIVDKMAESLSSFKKKGLPLPRIIKPGTKEYEDAPPLGGLISWGGSGKNSKGDTVYYNHVAYICKVVDKNTIYIVQSGYNGSVGPWNIYKCVRSKEWSYAWSNKPSGLKCNGFVSNPAIDLLMTAEELPDGVITEPEKETPPSLTGIFQPTPTSVTLSCALGYDSDGISRLDVYYRWGTFDTENDVLTNYSGKKSVSSSEDITIDKPRDSTSVSIVILQIDSQGNSLSSGLINKNLSVSLPASSIYVGGVMKQAVPYVWDDSSGLWRKVVPCIYSKGAWRALYTTGTEKVN